MPEFVDDRTWALLQAKLVVVQDIIDSVIGVPDTPKRQIADNYSRVPFVTFNDRINAKNKKIKLVLSLPFLHQAILSKFDRTKFVNKT